MSRARGADYDVTPQGGRYLKPSELATLQLPERWNGVGYVLNFGVQRGVYDVDYAGNARPEGTITGYENSTSVTRLGFEDGTACGA